MTQFTFAVEKMSDIMWHMNTRWGGRIYMTVSPTADCQTFSVGEIRCLFNEDSKDQIEYIKMLQKVAGKKQMLCNIQLTQEPHMRRFIEQNNIRVVFKNEYKSTRGSYMIFYLLDLTKTFNLP